ncbi:hypothetical protein P4V47_15300 [Brevibacillus laterosporus]|nr:hypothetical protein [Brevibacillus laterosporus]
MDWYKTVELITAKKEEIALLFFFARRIVIIVIHLLFGALVIHLMVFFN